MSLARKRISSRTHSGEGISSNRIHLRLRLSCNTLLIAKELINQFLIVSFFSFAVFDVIFMTVCFFRYACLPSASPCRPSSRYHVRYRLFFTRLQITRHRIRNKRTIRVATLVIRCSFFIRLLYERLTRLQDNKHI